MIEKHIVLNFDLGLRGDYNSLYIWLDNKNAIECGKATAAFGMNFSEDKFETIFSELKEVLEKEIKIEKNDRIYMVVNDGTCRMQGAFLFGGRKKADWTGYKIDSENKPDQF